MKRLHLFISRGYFPTQLPPPFSSRTFGSNASKISSSIPLGVAVQSECEPFSVSRPAYRRRNTKIPNAISHLLLCREMDSNWAALSRFFKKSKISLSTPKILKSGAKRAISIPSIGQLDEERLHRSAGYRYALVSDITQFFPSFYTHAISWALHSKAASKAAIKARPRRKAGYGDDLDLHARNCQSQQTVGIPIGPDTSHVLAEVVGVAVDLQLRDSLKGWPAGYRYVDDFVFFFRTRPDADTALHELNKALDHFELRPNENKTKVLPTDQLEADKWVYELRQFDFSHTKTGQTEELHHFFQVAFGLASTHPTESVMKWALRRLATEFIRKDNWPTFEAYLHRTIHANPDTLQIASQFLSTYRNLGYPIDQKVLRRSVEDLLSEHAPFGRHSEVAWALWIAIDNRIRVSAQTVRRLTRLRSSVCALLSLDLIARGLVAGAVSTSEWKKLCTSSSLYGPDWLLSYQAERDSLFGPSSFVRADPHFGLLLKYGVTFYDRSLGQPPLFEITADPLLYPPNEVANFEDDPEDLIEFADIDEDYIDR